MDMNILRLHSWIHDLYFFQFQTMNIEKSVEFFHAHEGLEILYIHHGQGTVIIDDQLYPIIPRTLFLFKPYQLHHTQIHVPPLYVRSLFKIKTSIVDHFAQNLPNTHHFLKDFLTQHSTDQVFYLSEQQDSHITSAFKYMDDMIQSIPEAVHKEAITLFLWKLMVFVISMTQPGKERLQNSPAIINTNHINALLQWLDIHFKHPFILEDIARDLNFSSSYLSRLFRNQTGKTIMQYTIEKRLEYSRMLLNSRSMSLEEIVQTAGFTSVNYFIRSFKSKYGLTPHQYRVHCHQEQ